MHLEPRQVSGIARNRFVTIQIDNNFNSTSTVRATEVVQTTMEDGNVFISPKGEITFQFDPNYQFPVLDVETLQPTGETEVGLTVYKLIQSYLFAKVNELEHSD